VGAAFAGRDLLAGIIELIQFFTTVDDAKSEEDLKACGKLFGDAVAKIGVDGLFFVLSMFGLKKASARLTTRTVVNNGLNSRKWKGKIIKERRLKLGDGEITNSVDSSAPPKAPPARTTILNKPVKQQMYGTGRNSSYSWKKGYKADRNYLGTGKIGNFSNLEGKPIEEVLARIPPTATRRELIPEVGKVTEGFEYKWVYNGKTYRARIHGADASAPKGSNAAKSWVLRIQEGKRYLDPVSLEYQRPGITNIDSPYYNEKLANRTHIPIKEPKR